MSCRAPRKWVGNWYKLLCSVHLRTVLARQCSSMQQRVQRRPVVNRHGALVAPFLRAIGKHVWRTWNGEMIVRPSGQLRRDNVRQTPKLVRAHVPATTSSSTLTSTWASLLVPCAASRGRMSLCARVEPARTGDTDDVRSATEDFGCCCFSTRALSKRTYEPRALQGVACSERLPKHEATGVAQAQVDAHAWVPGPEVLPSAENSQSPTEHRTGAPRLIARGIFLNPAVCAPKESWTPWGPPRRWVIAHVCTCFCERLFATLSGLAQRSNGTPCRALACAPHPTGAAHRLRLCAATLLARTVAVFWCALFSVFFSPCRASCACARPRLTSLSVAPNTRPSSAPGARHLFISLLRLCPLLRRQRLQS